MKQEFEKEVIQNIQSLGEDKELHTLTREWMCKSGKHNYVYNFSWLGRPIIQLPQDIVAMQEIIWSVKPDLIIETGIAHGGSIIFSAAMLSLLEKCDYIKKGLVVAIDIDIRDRNRVEIEKHPLCSLVKMIQGSSVDAEIVQQVKSIAIGYERVMVCLDSNHTHDHVLQELHAYAPLVSLGSYCVVFDTCIEDKVVLRMKVEELTKLLPVVMMITHTPSPADMLYFGTASSEYCEKFKCSPMQFIKDLQDIRQAFIEGIGFGSAHTVPKHMQKKNNKNYNRGSKPIVKSEP